MTKYQVHTKKTWPYGLDYDFYNLTMALMYAIEHNLKFISARTKIIWENPYVRKESK